MYKFLSHNSVISFYPQSLLNKDFIGGIFLIFTSFIDSGISILSEFAFL